MVNVFNRRLAVVILLLALLSCASAAEVLPPRAKVNIERYVSRHYGWRHSAYHIQRRANADGYAVFWVLHRDDAKRYMETGRGKSFEVLCDPRTFKIVKEVWFQ